MSKIIIRSIPEHKVTVEADETGRLYVNGIAVSGPVKHEGVTFVWAPKEAVGRPNVKIGLDAEHIRMIEDHSADYVAARKEQARKEREYDLAHNEGGDGFNPYRD